MHMDALSLQDFHQVLAHVLVEAAKRQVRSEDEVHLGAVAVEVAGELDGDVAASHHDQLLRLGWQGQRLVARDDAWQVRAGDGELDRSSATGDANIPRGEPLAVDLDGVGVDDLRVALVEVHACAVEETLVDAVEPRDLGVLSLDQLVPIQCGLGAGWELPAIALGILDVLVEVTAEDEQLLRHAPADDTSAAEAAGVVLRADKLEWQLGYSHLGAVLGGRPARAPDAATAAADGEQIVIVVVGALRLERGWAGLLRRAGDPRSVHRPRCAAAHDGGEARQRGRREEAAVAAARSRRAGGGRHPHDGRCPSPRRRRASGAEHREHGDGPRAWRGQHQGAGTLRRAAPG
mmetsp:Transcript_50845/g.148145  ORF Transcript_50845/g.148145 Transcript_50845/m.148145 type:complete len:348 (-) Transcript_50845:21-1064(-)